MENFPLGVAILAGIGGNLGPEYALAEVFSDKREKRHASEEALREELYRQIGQLKVELDWLKKNSEQDLALRRSLIDPALPMTSIRRQCELLGVSRSGLYRSPAPVSFETLDLMHRIDEQDTRTPFYGVLRMTAWLKKEGHPVNPKRVRRLMRLMGLEAIYPKPRLSVPHPEHQVFPSLLRGVPVTSSDQVWCSDITYIRLRQGFLYLVAIMDWYSRYVLSWSLSPTLDVAFCMEALERAFHLGRTSPEIFNTDQGSQFTSSRWIQALTDRGVKISMDGRGRALDNVFVERLWRSLKYEAVYLSEYESVQEARSGIHGYLRFYNEERLHQSLNDKTPREISLGKTSWNQQEKQGILGTRLLP
ncbi:IS3 family transposase [Leptospirillum sp. Group II 'CF-1']|uniref:IS3 family transposase n=1 Tax=Leptospirillum sp. Group II 'CF-1' TaxID=1660083 RepID=UPI0002DCF408|nr:IS3 family transposase [Leptospirillum sp. Group II 'CF-1']